jgi:hypothetical protein
MATQRHPYGVNDDIRKMTRVVSELIEQRIVIERMREDRETAVAHAGGDTFKDPAHLDLMFARRQVDDAVRKLEALMDSLESDGLDNHTRAGQR